MFAPIGPGRPSAQELGWLEAVSLQPAAGKLECAWKLLMRWYQGTSGLVPYLCFILCAGVTQALRGCIVSVDISRMGACPELVSEQHACVQNASLSHDIGLLFAWCFCQA